MRDECEDVLHELKPVIVGEVCLYIESEDNNYQDLWKGKAINIHEKFLDYKIGAV